jgi:hypothetical protein
MDAETPVWDLAYQDVQILVKMGVVIVPGVAVISVVAMDVTKIATRIVAEIAETVAEADAAEVAPLVAEVDAEITVPKAVPADVITPVKGIAYPLVQPTAFMDAKQIVQVLV